jgi:hypothetical protein
MKNRSVRRIPATLTALDGRVFHVQLDQFHSGECFVFDSVLPKQSHCSQMANICSIISVSTNMQSLCVWSTEVC